mmetsp:Transcript_4942/g.14962  ORF Transcript_4942/g.14962 Transcript_4942/m.14962 type:complete len:182 (-) Transcript_4942:320-865(-)
MDSKRRRVEPTPFEGVGRSFRSAPGGEAKKTRSVVNDLVGLAVFALPQSGGRDVQWFSGHVATKQGQLQVLAREEECPNECMCAGGYGHYRLTLTDRKRRLEAVARVSRTGGNCLRLSPLDASCLEFDADTIYTEAPAAAFVARFFPALAKKIQAANEAADADAVVNSGTLKAKQLVFTPL